jgi:glycosyltransferase involved in cell wall biosynthesis
VVVVDSLIAARVRPGALSRPVVASAHQRPGGLTGSRPRRAVRAARDLRLYRRAAAVVVPSAFLARELVEARVPGEIVHIVEPGADGAGGRPSRRERGEPGDGSGEVRFVTVANVSRHKRPLDVLEAFARLGDLETSLTMVGAAADHRLAGRVRARLAERALAGRASWEGSLPAAGVEEVLSNADVFVLPALGESYGTAVAEAMRAGLPAIVAASGNLPNLVRDGVDGVVVTARDVAGLSRAMRALAADAPRRAAMGASARRAAEGFSTWDAAAEAFCRVLSAVQSTVPAPPPGRRSAL